MMPCMLSTPQSPPLREKLLIPIRQVHPAVHFNQQIHENRHEDCAREDMAPDDIQAEIRQKHEGEAFRNGEPVCDLRVHFLVRVVREVGAGEEGDGVQREMQDEEESVVDEEGGEELQGQAAGCWGRRRKSPGQLQGRGECEVV